ncbi:MAG: hypothetical protein JNL97_08925, partial [Verrucomicrobiales bacterium]|nr:hypothetical protein [Verrucomicrobiales bacterium]
ERELRQQSATEVRTQVDGVTAGASAAAGSGTGANVAAPSPRSAGAEEADYVMCHPRLPRMAQWIVVYGLVVAPLLWLMSLGFLGAEKGSSPYAGFVRSIQNLVTLLGEGMVTAMWVRGAWKLRSLRVSGARTLVSAIWGHLCLGGLAVGLEVWLVNLRTVVEDPSAGEIGLGLAGLLALVFEIAALVWLNRNRHRLAMIGAEVRPSTEEVADELAATAPTTGVVRHATWSAVLTAASVVFGLAVIGGGALLGAAAYTNRGLQGAGLGPAEVAIALVGLLVVGGGGVVGAVLGWAGLREAKSRRERMAGFGRSLFGAMAWPLLFAQMAAMVGVGWILIRLEAASGTVLVTALAGTLVIGELGVRVVWRWIRSVPRGARAGRLPGTGRMLALGTALAAFVTLFPAYSVAWTGFLRSRIPPMVATVTSPEGSRSEGDLRVSYPPRSIVWWTASVYRDDVQIAEPRYTAHVVNGSLWEAAVHPVRVSGEADEGGHYGGWKLEVVSPTHSASFRAGGEGSPGVRWSRPAPGQEVSVAANETREIEVLAGTDSAGVRWAV